MYKENFNIGKMTEEGKCTLATKDTEVVLGHGIIGEFQDTIYHADGSVEVMEVQRNCIIKDIGKLIACLMKREEGQQGLTYWAIGSGSDHWDVVKPPDAQPTDNGCVNEIGRKAIPLDAIEFVDPDGNHSEEITNSIKITLVFNTDECNGVWREFSLFGGDATEELNSGLAINHKNHSVMVKNETMTIERQIRFIFN